MTNNLKEDEETTGVKEHEAIFVLVPTSEAKDSFEARKLVELVIQWREDIFYSVPYPRIGGYFSGLLSDICDEKAIVPYYNKELRETVRKNFSNIIPWLKDEIEKRTKLLLRPYDIKEKFPELKKYSDIDLLYTLKLELVPMGIDANIGFTRETLPPSELSPPLSFFRDETMVYIFRKITPYIITPETLRDGRDESADFGYEDDAMIVDECLYQEIIDKEKEKVIDIYAIGEKATTTVKRIIGKIPENIIGKTWIVLVDYIYYKTG